MRTSTCVNPTTVNELDAMEVIRMLSSHTWKIESVKRQTTGLYLAVMCQNCGAESVISAHSIDRPGYETPPKERIHEKESNRGIVFKIE
ncbi:MAG TPA: hypothetical protein VFF30_18005 [Nitrososphaerales archaeon]|nr:hypothetical protein [Nitrososphaerales archaeon]